MIATCADNLIGNAGATKIAEALKAATGKGGSVTDLNLRGNTIGSLGALKMDGLLRSNTSLRCLHLDLDDIGPAGVTSLADAIQVNTTLKELHLGINNLGAAGAVRMARAIKLNSALTRLNLGALSHECTDDSNRVASSDTTSASILSSTPSQPTDYSVFGGYRKRER